MIIDRKHFDLNKQCVIEKLLIKTPFKYGAIFQNEACFLYVKNGESILKSPTEKLSIHISESVLLKCGNYFADLIQNIKKQHCEIYAIHLQSDILKELYKDEIPSFIKPDSKKHFAKKIERQDIIIHFIESLDFYFQNPTLVNDELLKLKIKELILLLLQTNNAENIYSLFSHLFTPRQASLKDIIQTHLFSNLTVSDLATLSGRSLSAFKRDFESFFKDTPANYIKEQKLLKANDLLISTDFSITEICYEVGFSDTSHFTKLFKQKYHLAPSEYRKSKVLK
jgi:AraC family transcriptional regulator, exoenzyme S synthesis regulatory protein ExsA